MSQPVPEERNDALGLTEPPEDEHASELSDESDGTQGEAQRENAGSSVDQPSDG